MCQLRSWGNECNISLGLYQSLCVEMCTNTLYTDSVQTYLHLHAQICGSLVSELRTTRIITQNQIGFSFILSLTPYQHCCTFIYFKVEEKPQGTSSSYLESLHYSYSNLICKSKGGLGFCKHQASSMNLYFGTIYVYRKQSHLYINSKVLCP